MRVLFPPLQWEPRFCLFVPVLFPAARPPPWVSDSRVAGLGKGDKQWRWGRTCGYRVRLCLRTEESGWVDHTILMRRHHLVRSGVKAAWGSNPGLRLYPDQTNPHSAFWVCFSADASWWAPFLSCVQSDGSVHWCSSPSSPDLSALYAETQRFRQSSM